MNETELLSKIESMKTESFVGWSEDSKNGYLTAVITLEEFIKSKTAPANRDK